MEYRDEMESNGMGSKAAEGLDGWREVPVEVRVSRLGNLMRTIFWLACVVAQVLADAEGVAGVAA
jgi:hypothetical protein